MEFHSSFSSPTPTLAFGVVTWPLLNEILSVYMKQEPEFNPKKDHNQKQDLKLALE